MLNVLNIIQLVLYIALLALVGQGALHVLAGPRRDSNFFYRLLQVIANTLTCIEASPFANIKIIPLILLHTNCCRSIDFS